MPEELPDDLPPPGWSFRSGLAASARELLVIGQSDVLAALGEPDSFVLCLDRDTGRWNTVAQVEWTAIRLDRCPPGQGRACLLGNRGDVAIIADDGSVAEEQVDPGPDGPWGSGDLRDLRLVGGALFACGMGRRVYRRAGPGRWSAEDAGMHQATPVPEISGLNAIHGRDGGLLHAAGFHGEVWWRDGSGWHGVDTPTNLVLHRILELPDGEVIACGQHGVVLAGARDRWRVLDTPDGTGDLWGLAWFRDAAWLAAERSLYRIGPDRQVAAVDTGLGATWGYRHLHAGDGVLWSIGSRSVAWTDDGVTWTPAPPP